MTMTITLTHIERQALTHIDHAYDAERIARKAGDIRDASPPRMVLSATGNIRGEALHLAEKCRKAFRVAKQAAEDEQAHHNALRLILDEAFIAAREAAAEHGDVYTRATVSELAKLIALVDRSVDVAAQKAVTG